MKKIILLLPLLLFSTFQNSTCMHRKYMKKMYQKKGHQRNKKSFNQISKKQKKSHKKITKVNKTKNKAKILDRVFSPEKTYSKKSYMPKFSISFANKNLISIILMLYMSFYQLNKQKAFCYNPYPLQVGGYDPYPVRTPPSIQRNLNAQSNFLKQHTAIQKQEQAARDKRLHDQNQQISKQNQAAIDQNNKRMEKQQRQEAERLAKKAKKEEKERQQQAPPLKKAPPNTDSKTASSMIIDAMATAEAMAKEARKKHKLPKV